MHRPTFGRRGASQPARTQPPAKPAAPVPHAVLVQASGGPPPAADGAAALDEELRAWKQQRTFRIPWKQLCLMATVCFGLASFVLSGSVKSAVDWLLYGLSGVSFYGWIVARRVRRAKR